jgi:hypothetical protein
MRHTPYQMTVMSHPLPHLGAAGQGTVLAQEKPPTFGKCTDRVQQTTASILLFVMRTTVA